MIKLREWNETSKGAAGPHASRQREYVKRKADDGPQEQPVQRRLLEQEAITQGVDRLQQLTQVEFEWRQATLSKCVASPEPQAVQIPVESMGKVTATTFQKEFKKAHMRAWSALKEMPEVCGMVICSLETFLCDPSGCTAISCTPDCHKDFSLVVWSSKRSIGCWHGSSKSGVPHLLAAFASWLGCVGQIGLVGRGQSNKFGKTGRKAEANANCNNQLLWGATKERRGGVSLAMERRECSAF